MSKYSLIADENDVRLRFEANTPRHSIYTNPGRDTRHEPMDDKHANDSHTRVMSDQVTRHELEAKLEAIEAKMDARLVSVAGKIDAFLASQAERDKTIEQRDIRLQERVDSSVALTDEWNQKFRMLTERSIEAALSADASAKEAATLKTHFWASVVAQLLAVAALVVGAYFANQASVLGIASSTLSAYQAGKADATTKPKEDPPAASAPANRE